MCAGGKNRSSSSRFIIVIMSSFDHLIPPMSSFDTSCLQSQVPPAANWSAWVQNESHWSSDKMIMMKHMSIMMIMMVVALLVYCHNDTDDDGGPQVHSQRRARALRQRQRSEVVFLSMSSSLSYIHAPPHIFTQPLLRGSRLSLQTENPFSHLECHQFNISNLGTISVTCSLGMVKGLKGGVVMVC